MSKQEHDFEPDASWGEVLVTLLIVAALLTALGYGSIKFLEYWYGM